MVWPFIRIVTKMGLVKKRELTIKWIIYTLYISVAVRQGLNYSAKYSNIYGKYISKIMLFFFFEKHRLGKQYTFIMSEDKKRITREKQ